MSDLLDEVERQFAARQLHCPHESDALHQYDCIYCCKCNTMWNPDMEIEALMDAIFESSCDVKSQCVRP